MRIIYMGTPEFAVPTLETLHHSDHEVLAVITATDKWGGRGGKHLLQSAVKKKALELDLPILQPKNLKSPAFIEELRAYEADLQIVVAFRMLPVVVWDMPPHGTYNLHGSLLPSYRGAAPIHRAVMNGALETGITTFKLQHAIDTGSIAFQDRITIGPDDTTGLVYNRLMEAGPALVLKTVDAIENGTIALTQQDNTLVSHAPKIFHPDCEIDWNKTGSEVHNHIRGLNPFPTAWTKIGDQEVKILQSELLSTGDLRPGSYRSDNKTYLHIGAKEKDIAVLEIKPAGKRAMPIKQFLNGFNIEKWQSEVPLEISDSLSD